jgi:hypothetical protein
VHLFRQFLAAPDRDQPHSYHPGIFERCENTGRVKNFVMAAAKREILYPLSVDDTDIYKPLKALPFSWLRIPIKTGRLC